MLQRILSSFYMKKWAFVFYDVKFGNNFSITTLVFCFMHIYFDEEIILLLTHIKCLTTPIFASFYGVLMSMNILLWLQKIQTTIALYFMFLFDKDYGPQHRSSNILQYNTVYISSNIIHTVGATFPQYIDAPAFGVAFHCLISQHEKHTYRAIKLHL